MTGFSRTEPLFSLCGLQCALCPMHLDGHCPGCGGGAGNQSCAIARCSLEQGGVAFCTQCARYPCERYDGFDACDSFVPHQTRQRDLDYLQAVGLEPLLAEMREKTRLLECLLTGYNDGRHKTLFRTAAYLLPLPELRAVLEQLGSEPGLRELPPKERTRTAETLLRAAADRQGLELKLRRNPKTQS